MKQTADTLKILNINVIKVQTLKYSVCYTVTGDLFELIATLKTRTDGPKMTMLPDAHERANTYVLAFER